MKIRILTYLPHIIYFLVLGVLLLLLVWIVSPSDTGGGMDFTPFLQAALLFAGIIAYLIYDLSLHKFNLRISSQFIIFIFLAWSFRHYFKMQELNKLCSGHPEPPYDSLIAPPIDDFIVLWVVCQGILFYLFLFTNVSYMLNRKKLLTNRDNASINIKNSVPYMETRDKLFTEEQYLKQLKMYEMLSLS